MYNIKESQWPQLSIKYKIVYKATVRHNSKHSIC